MDGATRIRAQEAVDYLYGKDRMYVWRQARTEYEKDIAANPGANYDWTQVPSCSAHVRQINRHALQNFPVKEYPLSFWFQFCVQVRDNEVTPIDQLLFGDSKAALQEKEIDDYMDKIYEASWYRQNLE